MLSVPDFTNVAGVGRDVRRGFRAAVLRAVRSDEMWTLDDADILVGDESRFFRCEVEYAPAFVLSAPLCRRIGLEVTLAPPALAPERRSVRSFVAEARRDPPEVAAIACVAPAETAADKLGALTWRLASPRGGDGDDLVRHVHDLAALEGPAAAHPRFPELLGSALAADARRAGGAGRVSEVPDILDGDPRFRDRDRRFVAAMCYGSEDETPTFDRAVAAIRRPARLPD